MADQTLLSVLKILIVEDSPDDAELVIRRLKKEGFDFAWQQVQTEADYLAALEAGPDLVLSDWSLPQFSGLRALQLLRERDRDMPFIIVSGNIGEEAAIDAMRLGSHDYILKDRPERLGQAVRKALEQKHLRDERKQTENLLRLQSAALNAAANAIVITNRVGDIEWANPAFTALSGYSLAEVVGKNMRELIKSEQHNRAYYAQLWETILAGKVWQGETINRRKDGRLYIEEQTITPVYNSDGQISQFIAIKQDISERKQSEAALKTRSKEIQYLYEAGQQLSRTLDLKSLYTTLYHSIAELMEIDSLFISDYDSNADLIRCVFAMQDDQPLETREFPALPLEPEGHGTQSRVIHSHQSLLVNDYQAMVASASNRHYIDSQGQVLAYDAVAKDSDVTRSGVIIPLLLKERVVGVVQILSYKLKAYSQEDLKMAEALTAQFAVAGNNAALYQQAQIEIAERNQAEQALQKKAEELRQAIELTLQGWSTALELRERETAGHSQRVVQFTVDMAHELGFSQEEIVHIRRGTLLHDIGKIGIPDGILLKKGPLDDEEWIIMRQHPIYAYQLLSKIPFLIPALDIPYYHHERWDGSGYPRGLKGEEIPLSARIFAVVDVWDALSYERPYRPAWSQEDVLKYLKAQSGKQFDPRIVEVFFKLYPRP